MMRWWYCLFGIWLPLFGLANSCQLDLETAWMKINFYAPSIAITDEEIRIQEANTWQQNLIPNPVATIDGQNLGVDPSIDAEVPQTTYTLSQLWEFGGKRKARREFALSQTELAYWDLQIKRQDVRFNLIAAFIAVSSAQEKCSIAEQQKNIAAKLLEITQNQVHAGKISPIQERKASLALKATEVNLREAISQLMQEKKKLSSMWGEACPDFESVDYELIYREPLEPCETLQGIFTLPEMIKAERRILSAVQNVQLQKANGIPDATVSLGYRTYADSDQRGWVIAVSMPLPICNKNQGNIQKARFEVNQSEFQMDEVKRSLQERSQVVYEKYFAAYEEAEMIQKGILAEALETFELTKIGYEKGKLQYLDLLDAQKTFFEVQETFIDKLTNYHLSKAELDRLCGRYNCI